MSKFECVLNGNFDEILNDIDKTIMGKSISASYEDGSDFRVGNMRCAVRVYERYSYLGGNRVSMSIVLVEGGSSVCLSAITSGGSQATFFKINTFGEDAFLDTISDVVDKYKV